MGEIQLAGRKCHSHPVWLPWGRGWCWLHPHALGSVPHVNSHGGQPQPLGILHAAKLSLSPCLFKYQLRQGAVLPGGFSDVSELKTLRRHSWEEQGIPGQGDPLKASRTEMFPCCLSQNLRRARMAWVGSAHGLGSQ